MPAKPVGKSPTPEAQLQSFLDRFDAKHQKLIKSIRTAVRKRFPTANELAYDYPDSVVLSYSPTERGIEGIVATSAKADGVYLYFGQGAKLPDPKKLLKGAAKTTRFVPLESAAALAHPDIEALIQAAIACSSVPLPAAGTGKLIIQSSAEKRRPRKKTAK